MSGLRRKPTNRAANFSTLYELPASIQVGNGDVDSKSNFVHKNRDSEGSCSPIMWGKRAQTPLAGGKDWGRTGGRNREKKLSSMDEAETRKFVAE